MKLEINKNFDNLNQLIYSFQTTYDKNIFFILKSRIDLWMNNYIKKIIRKFPKVLIKYEELLYFKDIYFLKNLLKFNPDLGIPFDNFLIQHLKWSIFSKIRTFITNKKEKINYSEEYNENNYKHFNKYKSIKIKEPENYDYLTNLLSKLEKNIFNFKIKGYKNKEISSLLNISIKNIHNGWHRTKTKLKRYIIINNLNIF